jgi:UDP-N-acetylglucosamine--N-acetylmuramyl-(pentapeptide) pyrophosphoryl-undecaprenol N-acetylglucosamine transferase
MSVQFSALEASRPVDRRSGEAGSSVAARPLRIAFAGGGSGGHIYPALAVAQAALGRTGRPTEALFLVTRDGLERGVIDTHQLPAVEIPAVRLVRSNLLRILPETWAGIRAARKALREFGADVLYGTGGFVAFPACVAAWLEGIPFLLHEPNTVPGRANLVLCRLADGVITHFPQSREHFPRRVRCTELGTPLRYAYDPARRVRGRETTVLVLGGSQGAKALNRLVSNLYPKIGARPDLRLIHVTGTRDHDEVRAKLNADWTNIEVVPYTEEMDQVLYRTDVAICRSGALTVCELVEFGIPAIYVPFHNSVGNHQFENARLLRDGRASVIIEEPDLDEARLLDELERIVRPEVLEEHRRAMAGFRRPGASLRVLEALESLVRTDRGADV